MTEEEIQAGIRVATRILNAVHPDDVHYLNQFDSPAARMLGLKQPCGETVPRLRKAAEEFMNTAGGRGYTVTTVDQLGRPCGLAELLQAGRHLEAMHLEEPRAQLALATVEGIRGEDLRTIASAAVRYVHALQSATRS